MNRAWILAANSALLVLCCFLAGRTLAQLAAGWLTPPGALEEGPETGAAPAQVSWSDRQIVLARNLFNVSTLAPAGAETAEPSESYEKTRLPLALLGTAAAADDSLSWAAIEDKEAHEHQVVRIGDRLQGKAEVVRIERRRIVLRNGPKLEELALEEEDAAGPGSARRSPPTRRLPTRRSSRRTPRTAARSRPAVQRLAKNRFAVRRADVESFATNPAALFSQARIVPKYEAGSMVGVQLNAIKPGSLFEQIGIQNGDTITEFNGIQVTGQQESAQVLRELTTARQFRVKVRGPDGEERDLQYELR